LPVRSCSAQTTHRHRVAKAAAGNKGVYGSSGSVTFSQVWVDASGYWTTGVPDLCGIINGILTASSYSTNYPNGAVIDARGLVDPGGGSVLCNGEPFSGVTAPSTILLPAATIPVSMTWTLPNNTKIIGEGPYTSLQAQNPLRGTAYMIEMGSSDSCPSEGCSGVSIEHLLLDASLNSFVNGIHNQYAQTPSYVNDVGLIEFSLTGLKVEPGSLNGPPGAIDSGPYSNITFSTLFGSPCSGSTCAVCADIEVQTRGLHGITCIGSPQTGTQHSDDVAAIYVNASNNSVEDVHVEAFWDGIEVGNITAPVGNVLISNVTGSESQNCSNKSDCRVINVVHICGPQNKSQFGQCANTGSVSDVTILQDSAQMNDDPGSTTTVRDDVTNTSLVRVANSSSATTTGMYVLGEALGGGNTRFAVSPAPTGNFDPASTVVPTWGVGTAAPSTQSCSTPGALYSNTQGGSGTTVFVCTASSGSLTWQPIPPAT
jgi:hypothetical protein